MSNREVRIVIAAAVLIAAAFTTGRWTVNDPLLSCRRDIIAARHKRDQIREQPIGVDSTQDARRTKSLADARRQVEELEYICGR
jgi:hypothetical protein